jgi:rhodanese-related sulfurtransferase
MMSAPMDVSLAEMRRLVRDPHVVILDVLSPEAYATAHLPGAINIPTGSLRERVPVELPDVRRPIVVYCASPT